jgi:hypothetical protein
LAAALTFTAQAIVLLSLLSRRFPGLLGVRDTAIRAIAGAVGAAVVATTVLHNLHQMGVAGAVIALLAGAVTALPFIWKDARLLMNL